MHVSKRWTWVMYVNVQCIHRKVSERKWVADGKSISVLFNKDNNRETNANIVCFGKVSPNVCWQQRNLTVNELNKAL